MSKPSPLPEGISLSKDETAAMEERGGYSGPQLYPRTLSLVKKYRRMLDYPLHEHDESQQTQLQHREAERHDMKEASDEPIKSSSTSALARSPLSAPGSDTTSSLSPPHHLEQSSPPQTSAQPIILTLKTVFCSGGHNDGRAGDGGNQGWGVGGPNIHRYDHAVSRSSGANHC